MHLQGVPKQSFYDFANDRYHLDLIVGRKTYHLYATGAVAQRLQRMVRRDTSGISVTLNPTDPQEITAFSIIL